MSAPARVADFAPTVTVTSTAPLACAGATTESVVALTTVTAVPALPPNETLIGEALVNPFPTIVTGVPPAGEAVRVEIESIAGSGTV